MDVHVINVALRKGDVCVVVPVYLTMGILLNLGAAGVFFGEFDTFYSLTRKLLFSAGIAGCLLGVLLITLSQHKVLAHSTDAPRERNVKSDEAQL